MPAKDGDDVMVEQKDGLGKDCDDRIGVVVVVVVVAPVAFFVGGDGDW